MSLNSSVELGLAIEQLRSHKLSELFTQTLGWDIPEKLKTIHHLGQRCVSLAQRDDVTVWQVLLTAKTPFTTELRQQIYQVLHGGGETAPLVIFVATDRQRSLWCQSVKESALYVVDGPTTLWQYRLRRLASGKRGLFPTLSEHDYETFAGLVESLYSGIIGIESIADRRLYSILTLQRLMFIQQIQQKGWLASDTWYLQVRFESALQKGENLFFSTCLRPLYRCLSLPAVERPIALQTEIGAVPFLGQLFHAHWLEEKYGAIAIVDSAFEVVLGWLSEQSSADSFNPWMVGDVGYWMAQYWMAEGGKGKGGICLPEQAREICDRTLDRLLLNRLNVATRSTKSAAKGSAQDSSREKGKTKIDALFDAVQPSGDITLNDLLFMADSRICRRLIQEILPELRILDPYCGSGQLLVAFHQRLTDIFSILTGYIQQTKNAQLKIWRSALSPSNESGPDLASSADEAAIVLKNLQERILKNNIYGVAETSEVAASAHFYLLLHLVATAPSPTSIEPLINLEFNLMSGNALVGFIKVDEERFDQVNKAGPDSVLQGNLLQPLAADSYETILSEKNIALEHYQARSQLMASTHSVPPYARAALLREEILSLDARAQYKLDTLLLSHMSQQLGMRYREMQLTDKPQRRPMMLNDVSQFSSFHWGYHFSEIVKEGGFDVVACVPLWGAFKPTAGEFLQQFEDLAEKAKVSKKTFKTSKQALAKGDTTLAKAWLAYQDRYACVADYFARSEQYTHQMVAARGRQFFWEQLFVERCFHLLSSSGTGAVVVPREMMRSDRAQTLMDLLDESKQLSEIVLSETSAMVVWEKT